MDEKSSSKRRFQKDRVAEKPAGAGNGWRSCEKSFHERSPQSIRRLGGSSERQEQEGL